MTIHLDPSTRRRLEAFAKQQGRSPEEVAASLLEETLSKVFPDDREEALVRRIVEGLPDSFWARRAELEARAEGSALTREELEEWRALLLKTERWQVDRLEAVVELADLRGENPQSVMHRLGILPA